MRAFKVFCADCKQGYEVAIRDLQRENRDKPSICGMCGSDFIAVKLVATEHSDDSL